MNEMSVKGSGSISPQGGDTPIDATHATAEDGPPLLSQPLVMENLGLEGLAAMLLTKSAQDQMKLNRDGARTAARTRIGQLLEQHDKLCEQAENMRGQAACSAAFSTIGLMCEASGGKTLKGGCDVIVSLGNKLHEADQKVYEADATLAGARAKEAEADRDEYNNNVKAAESMIDKAQQALQSFVAERAATRRAILKS